MFNLSTDSCSSVLAADNSRRSESIRASNSRSIPAMDSSHKSFSTAWLIRADSNSSNFALDDESSSLAIRSFSLIIASFSYMILKTHI